MHVCGVQYHVAWIFKAGNFAGPHMARRIPNATRPWRCLLQILSTPMAPQPGIRGGVPVTSATEEELSQAFGRLSTSPATSPGGSQAQGPYSAAASGAAGDSLVLPDMASLIHDLQTELSSMGFGLQLQQTAQHAAH